jgi:antitoxin (DNA-binding transcriptional repressor) of toxin-antitoxin stability system
MARNVNMHLAKSTLSELVRAAEAGEAVILARDGEPVARIVAIGRQQRRIGLRAGTVPDVDAMVAASLAPLEGHDLAEWLGSLAPDAVAGTRPLVANCCSIPTCSSGLTLRLSEFRRPRGR